MADTSTGSNWAKFIAAVAVFGIIGKCVNPDPPPVSPKVEAAKEKEKEPECEKTDLQCRGEKARFAASILCKSAVEASASHNFRWTDGFMEPKFSHYRWTKKPGGRITVMGDKIEFMNAYGAYFPMVYECDMGDDDKSAVNLRVEKGRLR